MPIIPSLPFLVTSSDIDQSNVDHKRKQTADLREKWRRYQEAHKDRDIASERNRRYLPLKRQQLMTNRNARSATSLDWIYTKPDVVQRWRKEFEHKWTKEVTKESTMSRLNYVREVKPETPPMKTFVMERCNTEKTIFYKSGIPQPKSAVEREMRTRFFVDPTWKSEGVSWRRFNDNKVPQFHRYSLF